MQKKSLFLTIVVGLMFLAGAQPMLTSLFGEYAGLKIVLYATLAYQLSVVFLKRFYNSGTWTKGWSTGFFVFNIASLIPVLVAVVQSWGDTNGVNLNPVFVEVMGKAVAGANFLILVFNTDWKAMVASLQQQLEEK